MQNKSSRAFLALILLSFVCYALYTCLFGSLSPLMMEYYAVGAGDFGLFSTMLGIGGIAAALLCALLGDRLPRGGAMAAGLVLLAAATLATGLRPGYGWVAALALAAGIGYTIIDVTGNASLAALPNSKTVVPVAQAVFSVGSTAGPMLCALLINPQLADSFATPFLVVGGLTVLVCLYAPFAVRRAAKPAPESPPDSAGGSVFRRGRFWALLAGALCYNAFLTGISAWLPAYFSSYRGFAADQAAMTLTVFFAGVLVMRFFGPLVFSRMAPQRVFIAFSAVSALAMAAALLSGEIWLCMALIAISGGFSAFCPAAIIMMGCAMFPQNRAAASSIAVFSYNIGFIVASSLFGSLIAVLGHQPSMLLLCGLYAAGVLIIALLSRRCRSALKNA